MKNTFYRLFVRLFSKQASHAPPSRFLVVSTTALGDTLWAAPGIESLKRSFPDGTIALLTTQLGEEIFRLNPAVDRIFTLGHKGSLFLTLRKEQFDTILIFHASQRFILPLCACLGAERIVGTRGLQKGLDDLLTHAVPSQQEHEIDRRSRLVEAVGGRAWTRNLSFFLQKEEEPPPSERWIVLHPGANDSYKLWPVSHFGTVGRALQEQLGCRIAITGSAKEIDLMNKLKNLIPGAYLIEPTSLRSFALFLSKAALLICNDSGPLHLASALKVPVIGIYSPTDPALCGPLECVNSEIIAKPRTCSPCLGRKCREPFCLLQISPQEVIEQVLSSPHFSHFRCHARF